MGGSISDGNVSVQVVIPRPLRAQIATVATARGIGVGTWIRELLQQIDLASVVLRRDRSERSAAPRKGRAKSGAGGQAGRRRTP